MTVEENGAENTTLLCLRVAAEADPTILSRLLGHFQYLNIVPCRVVAEFATRGLVHIQIDVSVGRKAALL